MKMRMFFASLHLLNFLVGIFVTIYVLNTLWNLLEVWHLILYIYYLALGFCGVATVCWIVMDGKEIEHGVVDIQDLERRILDLERKINDIKTRTLKKS